MTNPIDPGSPDAVHLAYRGDTAGICGRSTGVLTSEPGDYDCPECDGAYVGIMNVGTLLEYLQLVADGRTCTAPDGEDARPCGEVLPCDVHTDAETLRRWKDRAPAGLDRKALPSAFPDAPPVRTHADGGQEYGPYAGGWLSGGMAPQPEKAVDTVPEVRVRITIELPAEIEPAPSRRRLQVEGVVSADPAIYHPLPPRLMVALADLSLEVVKGLRDRMHR